MKFSLLSIRLATIFLSAALVMVSASVQKTSPAETSSARQKDSYSIGSASALLKPPNTASPWATLRSFIENMNRAYSLLMKAHHNNLKSPGFFP